MKRMLMRLGALGLVVVGGFFAVAQAQRILGQPDEATQTEEGAPTTPDGEPPALADAGPKSLSAPKEGIARDPFAGSRLLDVAAQSPPPQAAPQPKLPPLQPRARYPELETAASNPLRSSDSTPASGNTLASGGRKPPGGLPNEAESGPGAPMRDNQVALASHSDDAEPPTAAPKPNRDPFARSTRGPLAADPNQDADAAQRSKMDRLDPPLPIAGEAGRYPTPDAARPAPLKESPPDHQGANQPDDRYAKANKSIAPAELPRDDALQSMTQPRPVGNTFDRPAASLGGHTPRDPAAARPGGRQLEGPQAPQVTLQKLAPAEIQVGSEATFQLLVRNTGTIPARDVVVRDVVPDGTSLISTSPTAQVAGADLQWSLGTLQPGEEKSLAVKVMPQTEGEIGSVATVAFQAEATARTISTRPELLLEINAPRQVMIGENAVLSIRVSNTGSGVASGVVLHQKLPPQLKHEAGAELEFDVGDLKPREAKQVELTLTAAAAGKVVDVLSARAHGGLSTKATAELEILAPSLEVSFDGPRRRFLEHEATYTLCVANPGTAPAKDVELVSHLPKGLKFVSANNAGQYNQQTHAVYWSLAELPEGESGKVQLVTVPVEAGEQKLIVEGRADRNLNHRQEEQIEIQGLAAIMFEVADVADPIQVGAETAYEIRVVNQGTKAADNVQLVAQLPAEMKGLSAEGPTRGVVEGNRVMFEPLARLAPKVDTTYRIRVQSIAAGDQRVRIQLKTDDMEAPVTKEESTRVFGE